MSRRGPDNIARRTRDPAAEASPKVDTSEPATGMTAPFTHDGNSRNAVSVSRLASPGVARAASESLFFRSVFVTCQRAASEAYPG
jgi:hypothetical protein